MYARKLILKKISAAVGGVIIYYNNFAVNIFKSFQQRTQALLKKVFNVIIYYDYTKQQSAGCEILINKIKIFI